MGLQLDGCAVELLVEGLADVAGFALQLEVIVDQHAVKEDLSLIHI